MLSPQWESFYERTQFTLKVWLAIANNVRMRDKIVKILQYSCQMIVGYFNHTLSIETLEALQICRRTASTSRKAFWLFKSLNHCHECMVIADKARTMSSFDFDLFITLLRQLFFICYYFLENLIFLWRAKLIAIDEQKVEYVLNWTWFGGDLASFIIAVARVLAHGKYFVDDCSFPVLLASLNEVAMVSQNDVGRMPF